MTRNLVAVAALSLLAGCKSPVRVGAIVSRTGTVSTYGEQVARGFDLAVSEVNAAGGVDGRKLELLYRDDSTNPEIGLAAVRDLVEREHVTAVLGAVSSNVTLRLAPYCERYHVVLVSPTASAPLLTTAGEYIFRTYPSDVLEGASMADFARDLGLDRVAVLADDNTYGEGLAKVFVERFHESGGSVVASLTFPEGNQAAIADAVSALQPLAPRGVYIPAYIGDLATTLKKIHETALRPILLGTSAAASELVNAAGDAAENVVLPLPAFDPSSDSTGARSFANAFSARYGMAPDLWAAHAYDAVKVLALAAHRAGSWEARDLKDALLRIDDYAGATGRLAFDRNGDVVQYPTLYVVRDGQLIAYPKFVEGGGALPVPGR